MRYMKIGELARLGGVGIETVRFYEREGLLDKPARTGSGYRQYPEETVARLRFVKRAKELGFTLREIVELLSLRHDPAADTAAVKRRAEAKIADIETRIRDLQRTKDALQKLADTCPGHGPASGCPILEALNGTAEAVPGR